MGLKRLRPGTYEFSVTFKTLKIWLVMMAVVYICAMWLAYQ